MGDEAKRDVTQLADQLAEGFTALSGEYQALFDQQRQLECKLSWAKQQVSIIAFSFLGSTSSLMMIHLALDLQLFSSLDRQQPHVILILSYATPLVALHLTVPQADKP